MARCEGIELPHQNPLARRWGCPLHSKSKSDQTRQPGLVGRGGRTGSALGTIALSTTTDLDLRRACLSPTQNDFSSLKDLAGAMHGDAADVPGGATRRIGPTGAEVLL